MILDLNLEDLRKKQIALYAEGTGRTLAMLATALEVSVESGRTVQVVAKDREAAKELCEEAAILADHLDLAIYTLMDLKLVSTDIAENPSIYFSYPGSMLRGNYSTFYDHAVNSMHECAALDRVMAKHRKDYNY